MNSKNLKNYLNRLGLHPNRMTYYLHAITHPSYTEINSKFISYERLEFLGNYLTNKIISEYLYNSSDNLNDIINIYNNSIKEGTLAQAAKKIELGQLIVSNNVKISNRILCDCFEALVAAIYLDQNNENFIRKLIVENLFN
ncbi:Ribonuclease III, RNase III domain-containing protein [[Mycoplasma] cavipharyngis]|uniref:ribonuclease III domain-containing protein n=1 Tax=[Mycoplasma] cavipharyngis TaxID=92757 RepID=UPI003703ECE2